MCYWLGLDKTGYWLGLLCPAVSPEACPLTVAALPVQVQLNGEYVEECYCSKDNCNSAPGRAGPALLLAAPLLGLLAAR